MSFSLSEGGGGSPGQSVVISPINTIENNPVHFSWRQDSPADDYRVKVVDAKTGTVVWQGSVSRVTSSICINAICQFELPTNLPGGSYKWQVAGENKNGLGSWSDISSFSVVGEIPGKVVLISPDGTQETNPVTFKWQADSAATGYNLKIINSGNIVFETSLGDVNTFTLNSQPLPAGNYSWQVQGTLNGAGGLWSDAKLFSIASGKLPGAVTLIGPSGKTMPPVTYEWKEDNYATQYRIWLEGDFTIDGEWGQWYDASQICQAGTCSVSAALLREGNYSWKVQAQNEFGVGPESKTFTFYIIFR